MDNKEHELKYFLTAVNTKNLDLLKGKYKDLQKAFEVKISNSLYSYASSFFTSVGSDEQNRADVVKIMSDIKSMHSEYLGVKNGKEKLELKSDRDKERALVGTYTLNWQIDAMPQGLFDKIRITAKNTKLKDCKVNFVHSSNSNEINLTIEGQLLPLASFLKEILKIVEVERSLFEAQNDVAIKQHLASQDNNNNNLNNNSKSSFSKQNNKAIESTLNNNDELEVQIKKLETELGRLGNISEQHASELELNNEKINKLEKENKKLNNNTKKLQEKIVNSKEAISIYEKSNSELKKEITVIQKDVDKLKEEIEIRKSDQETNINKMKSEFNQQFQWLDSLDELDRIITAELEKDEILTPEKREQLEKLIDARLKNPSDILEASANKELEEIETKLKVSEAKVLNSSNKEKK